MEVPRHTIAETGLATSLVRERTALRTVFCRVVGGPSPAAEIALGSRPLVIGADPTCDLILQDPKVSRRHAELTLLSDGLHLRDLGSTNGTFLDSARVSEATITPGTTFRCGGSTLRVLRAPPPLIQPSARHRFGGMVGDSLLMRELFAVLELAAPTDATVLLQGESGTGKELAARALHDHSQRASGPFVVVDCSATTEQLLESQLFGHRAGAFTGAVSSRNGAFVEAHGGTLFLDEIGELPVQSQGRLLRALESHTVQPLGADRPVSVDTRIIAATHRDLSTMVESNSFRFDLFHRLSVVHVAIPSLRDRTEDIPALVRHFYEGRGVAPGPIDGENLSRLSAHSWPGNARELRNVLERACVLAGGTAPFRELAIWLETAPAPSVEAHEMIDTSLPFKEAKEQWLARFERRYLAAVFERHGFNITKAAQHAGLSRRHFRELVEQHGLKKT